MAFVKFLKCVATSVLILVMLEGLTITIAGIYTLIKVDFNELIGDAYKQNIPSPTAFLEGIKPPTVTTSKGSGTATEKDMQDFVDAQIKKLSDIATNVAVSGIVLGSVIMAIAIFGLVVYYCFDKKWILLIMLACLLLGILGMSIYCTIYLSSDSHFQNYMFEPLEEVAFKKEATHRFYMAALQYSLSCCGVRSAIDYYCKGVYDYKCNPGCMTFKLAWNTMVGRERRPPICAKTQTLEDQCMSKVQKPEKKPYTWQNCKYNLNRPSPVDASKAKICKNYKKHFSLDGATSLTSDRFTDFDPGLHYVADEVILDPGVHGSVFWDNTLLTRTLYGGQDLSGCGYKLWFAFPFTSIISTALWNFIFLDVLVAFVLSVTIVAIFGIFKEKIKENQKQKESSNVNRAKAWASKSETRFFTSS